MSSDAAGDSGPGTGLTKADKARAYRQKLKETLDQAQIEESRRKNRERQKRFRDKQKQLKQDGSATQAVLQAAASAPGGFDAASALQHAHSLAAYGIADPAAIAQAIMAIALPESGYSGKASQPAANAQQQQLPAEPSFGGIADDGAGELLAGVQAAAAAAHAAMLTSGGAGPSYAPRAAKRMRTALAAASGGGAASGGTDVDVNVDVRADVGGDDSTNGDAERPSPDAEGREELHALSAQLAAGFCEATSALDARACAAVLRGFLASVRGALGDEVWADVCMPAGGSARYLHVDAIGNRLATTSEAVAVAPALMYGTPLL